ncbi:MAG: fructose-6-phosphate aldolase [Planctomycetota bacterium]|jgi:transaldolase
MKIFLDTANIEEIRVAAATGILDGVTTNPSLIAKEGKAFEEVIAEICSLVDGPISAEVVSTEAEGMINEARHLASLHDNIVVKVPLTRDGIQAVSTVSEEGIRTNVTLCFSPLQALLAAKAGATMISPFAGRLDDIGHDGMEICAEIVEIYENYGYTTEVLVASIRSPKHVLDAALMGADIATIPTKVFDSMFGHPLTDKGLAAFLADWDKAGDAVTGAVPAGAAD